LISFLDFILFIHNLLVKISAWVFFDIRVLKTLKWMTGNVFPYFSTPLFILSLLENILSILIWQISLCKWIHFKSIIPKALKDCVNHWDILLWQLKAFADFVNLPKSSKWVTCLLFDDFISTIFLKLQVFTLDSPVIDPEHGEHKDKKTPKIYIFLLSCQVQPK